LCKPRCKPNCPDGENIQQIILNKTAELQKQILIYNADNKEYTIGKLPEWNNQKIIESKVGKYFQELTRGHKIFGLNWLLVYTAVHQL